MTNKNGFTMIEMILVMAIMAIMITVLIPSVKHVNRTVENEMVEKHEETIRKSLAQYFILEGNYPETLVMLSKDDRDNNYGILLDGDCDYSYSRTEEAYVLSIERK